MYKLKLKLSSLLDLQLFNFPYTVGYILGYVLFLNCVNKFLIIITCLSVYLPTYLPIYPIIIFWKNMVTNTVEDTTEMNIYKVSMYIHIHMALKSIKWKLSKFSSSFLKPLRLYKKVTLDSCSPTERSRCVGERWHKQFWSWEMSLHSWKKFGSMSPVSSWLYLSFQESIFRTTFESLKNLFFIHNRNANKVVCVLCSALLHFLVFY